MSQNIVITGCASGIAKCLAGKLHAQGHHLTLVDINEPGLKAAVADLGIANSARVHIEKLDITDPDAFTEVLSGAVARSGPLDVLLNVAAFLTACYAHEAEPAAVHRTIDVNVKGVMFGTNAAAKIMVAQGHGHIVNVASLAGVMPVPGISLYSASKYAVRGYSLAVAQELHKHGVAVTVVCPGLVATPMMDMQLHMEEASLTFAGRRALAPEEVADSIIASLKTRPIEVIAAVPYSGEAFMAKLVNSIPSLAIPITGMVAKMAKRRQAKAKADAKADAQP